MLAPVAPENYNEQLAYTQASIIAGYNTLADLRERGSISREQGQEIFDKLDQASTMIRIAKDAANIGNQVGAEKRLADAMALLLAIEHEMKEAQTNE